MPTPSASPQRPRGRPPRPRDDGQDVRSALLRAGMVLMTEQGIHAVGLDRLLKHAGVPKGSFYHYFASKEAFVLAVIGAYGDYFCAWLDRHLRDGAGPWLARIEAFAEDVMRSIEAHDYRCGCLIGNLGQEVVGLPDELRQALEQSFQAWQQRLAEALRQAVQRGELAGPVDADQQAAFFWIGWEGAVMRARLQRDAYPLRLFLQRFLQGLPRPT